MAPIPPSSQEKRKRLVLTLPKKIGLVKRMEKGESCAKLMAEYGVGSSTIYDLKKQKDKLLSFVASTEGPTSKTENRKSLKGPKMGELDCALYMWFQARRLDGKAVSGTPLIDEAKKLKGDLGIEECNFSVGWLHNFKEWHCISGLKVQGKRNSADHEAAENISQEFIRLIREHKVSPEQVYNTDETSLFWRCLPTSTLLVYTEKEALGFKLNKDCITMLPCANAVGAHKRKTEILTFLLWCYKRVVALFTKERERVTLQTCCGAERVNKHYLCK